MTNVAQLLWWAEREVASGDIAAARLHLTRAATRPLTPAEAQRVSELLAQTVPTETPLADRHRAQAGGLGVFGAAVLATCPRCSEPGTVLAGPEHPGGRFTCGRCAFRAERAWLGLGRVRGEARCRGCGTWISVDRPTSDGRQHPSVIAAHCPTCQRSVMVVVQLSTPDGFHEGPPREPAMGLPLWLAVQTRHGWLWALNAEHLEELRHLVAARVRDTPDGNAHWANRLPTWIVAAKNRDEIGRALDRLRAKLP